GARWLDGEFDLALGVPASEVERDPSTRPAVSGGMQTMYLGFAAGRPPFDDVRLRRAVAHAIDRVALELARATQFVRGSPAETGGMIPPALPGHSHRVAPRFDPPRARELLAAAGYPA